MSQPKLKVKHRLKVKQCSKPKRKSRRASVKRFETLASGVVIANQCGKRHNMRKRSSRQLLTQTGSTALRHDVGKRIKKYHFL